MVHILEFRVRVVIEYDWKFRASTEGILIVLRLK